MSGTREPRIRRRVSLTLVGVALVSVLLLSGVNFFFARQLLNDSVDSQLVALRDTRIQAFERGFARHPVRCLDVGLQPERCRRARRAVGRVRRARRGHHR